MDLIYTTAKRADEGVLKAHTFDLSFGAEENDYELTLGASEPVLEYGAFVYIEGTEYGGIVDGMRTNTDVETLTYMGRTWHGIMNSKVIQPDSGQDYFIVSGDANAILAQLVNRLGLGGLFAAKEEESGINISRYQFQRYCKGYDGIRALLESNGAKLKIEWKGRKVLLYAARIDDYTDTPVDGDEATLTGEHHENKVNHLICLGRGDLAEREVIHLFVDQFGRIGNVQYYTGLNEIAETYDNNSAESSEELRTEGISQLEQLRNNDSAEISSPEGRTQAYDIGDIVGASDVRSGVTASAAVSQKIVKINDGVIKIEYKTGSE